MVYPSQLHWWSGGRSALYSFHKTGDPSLFGLFHRQGQRFLPHDRTLADSGVVHGDVLELGSVRDALYPDRSKTAESDPKVRTQVTQRNIQTKAAKKSKERWQRIRELPAGGQAHTFLVWDSLSSEGTLYVQKRLKNKNRIQRFKREIEASLTLSHPNVIKVEYFELEGKAPYLVTEYCERGTLSDSDILTREPVYRLEVFAAISKGVGHAHSNEPPIVHRDLKPENIFIRRDGSPVVGDWGICYLSDDGERMTELDEVVGPRGLTCPELEGGRASEVKPSCDVYILGKLLYWMFSGKRLPREEYREPVYNLTASSKDAAIHFVYELLDQMITKNPTDRFPDANVVASKVEGVIAKLRVNAHIINLKTPQRCMYCGDGWYRVVVDPHQRLNRDRLADLMRGFGLEPRDGVLLFCTFASTFRLQLSR